MIVRSVKPETQKPQRKRPGQTPGGYDEPGDDGNHPGQPENQCQSVLGANLVRYTKHAYVSWEDVEPFVWIVTICPRRNENDSLLNLVVAIQMENLLLHRVQLHEVR
eukprot:6284952-Amphidinium_carterae.1